MPCSLAVICAGRSASKSHENPLLAMPRDLDDMKTVATDAAVFVQSLAGFVPHKSKCGRMPCTLSSESEPTALGQAAEGRF
jgi:hypothetical protein